MFFKKIIQTVELCVKGNLLTIRDSRRFTSNTFARAQKWIRKKKVYLFCVMDTLSERTFLYKISKIRK